MVLYVISMHTLLVPIHAEEKYDSYYNSHLVQTSICVFSVCSVCKTLHRKTKQSVHFKVYLG